MFYDKQSMSEMYELSIAKKKRTGKGWHMTLITSQTEVKGVLGEKDFSRLHKEWIRLIKKMIHKNDAAYLINDGNIFLLLSEHHAEQFKNELEEHVYINMDGKACVRSKLTFLSEDVAEFLLNMP